MKKIKLISAISFVCCICLILPSCKVNRKYSQTYIDYFDTVTTFTVYGVTRRNADRSEEILESELERYHKLFDIYNSYDGINNLKDVNDNAGISSVTVDSEIIELIDFSVKMYEVTSGHVNVAMGSVLSLWHNCRAEAASDPDSASVPSESELREADMHTEIDSIKINKENGEVYITDRETSIDVGAVAKGYVAERIADKLVYEGYEDFVLSLGGNIVTRGCKERGALWQIGIEDPQDTSKSLFSLELMERSLVTSGSYQRYYTVNGEHYHHIIDPFTLRPENEYVSVSVISEDSAVADAYSTALFNMSLVEGMKLVAETEGVEAMWVTSSGEKLFSENFEAYIVS